MEHISKTLEAAQNGSATNSTESHEKISRKTDLPHHWVSALFKKLQARYGHKWTSSIDGIEKVAVEEWAHVLAGMTGDDIARGIELWKESWPPSAVEFRNICRKYATAAHRPFDKSKAIEHKPDPEVARKAIDKMLNRKSE